MTLNNKRHDYLLRDSVIRFLMVRIKSEAIEGYHWSEQTWVLWRIPPSNCKGRTDWEVKVGVRLCPSLSPGWAQTGRIVVESDGNTGSCHCVFTTWSSVGSSSCRLLTVMIKWKKPCSWLAWVTYIITIMIITITDIYSDSTSNNLILILVR